MQCLGPFQEKNAWPIMIKARYDVFANTSVLLQIISFYLRVSAVAKVSPKMPQSLDTPGDLNLHKNNTSLFFLFVRYL